MSRPSSPDHVAAEVESVLDAARAQRPADMRAALSGVAETRGLGPCIDEVLLPAMRLLGSARPCGDDSDESTVALGVETARAWLETLTTSAPVPTDGPPVLMACAPGDRHSLALEALTVLLRHRQQRCRVLGPRISARAISIATEVSRPAAIVLASQLESGHRRASSLLGAIDRIGVATFYAGATFDPPPARRGLPGAYLGTNLERACEVVLHTLRAETVYVLPRSE